jgi:hypothetical protein
MICAVTKICHEREGVVSTSHSISDGCFALFDHRALALCCQVFGYFVPASSGTYRPNSRTGVSAAHGRGCNIAHCHAGSWATVRQEDRRDT